VQHLVRGDVHPLVRFPEVFANSPGPRQRILIKYAFKKCRRPTEKFGIREKKVQAKKDALLGHLETELWIRKRWRSCCTVSMSMSVRLVFNWDAEAPRSWEWVANTLLLDKRRIKAFESKNQKKDTPLEIECKQRIR